jgi:FKBP-type peptidyl-prolyl cis-trans isomerase FkpA
MATITTSSGLQYDDLKVGQGSAANFGSEVLVHYTGWLTDGTKFDSSRDRDEPFGFALGQGNVIAGWEEGVSGMRVGGLRKLVIPPALGYGAWAPAMSSRPMPRWCSRWNCWRSTDSIPPTASVRVN